MTLFPLIQSQQSVAVNRALPLCKEVDWDFQKNIPIYKKGSPSIITGLRAVLVWAWKALHTQRFRHEIYSWDYGCELEALIGRPFTEELKRSEAVRYVRECLMVNPYISEVNQINVDFRDEKLTITCKLKTIYGEVSLDV
ncbi:MAG: DUF2634 domain-containing protein [Clostridiales bacterium]